MSRALAIVATVGLLASVGMGDNFYVTRDTGINHDDAYDNQGARTDVRTAKWGCKESYIMDLDTAAVLSLVGSDPLGHYRFTLYIMPSTGWPVDPVSVNVQTINANADWAEGDDPNRFNSFGWTEGTPAATGEYAQCYWIDVGGTPTLDVDNCITWQREDGTPESQFQYLPASYANSLSLSGSSADHGSYISVQLDTDLVDDLLNNAKNRGLRMYRNAGDNLETYTREAAAGQRPYLEVLYLGPTVQFDKKRSYGDESQASASLAVSLNASSSDTVTVDYAVTGGDAAGGGVDYTLDAGQLVFNPGQTTQYIPVTIVDDGDNETNEKIEVTLSNPTNATVGANAMHTYVILDNDATGGWQEVMAEVHADYAGAGGTIARFGDSISYSAAFFKPLQWAHANTTPDDDTALSWIQGYMTADCWTWQDDTKAYDHGCMSGKTSAWPMQVELDPVLMNIEYWLDKHKPEIAVIMWGTNDLHAGPDLAGYTSNMTEVVRACKAYGTVPILTTIPPRRSYETKSSQYADAVRQIAADENVPLIDYNQEILTRRPEDWDGTLISGDGIHPSNTAPTQDFSQTMLSLNGYTLRNWMSLHECHDVYQQVLGGPTTWNVYNIGELENAVSNYNSGDEIVIHPGTYVLGVYLSLNTPDVIFRGSTGNPDDVILTGPGMNVNADPKEGLVVNADDVTVMDLTIQEVYWNGIHIRGENDVDRTWIANVKTLNCGERHIKGSSDQASTTKIADDILIEFVVMLQTKERSGSPDDNYIGGIDIMGAKDMIIRDTVGINIHGATGGGRGMMMVYMGQNNPTVERCKAYGCDRGICFGNPSGSGHAYMAPWCVVGGIIRNCFVTRPGESTIAMELCDTKDVKVYHNTIYSEDASYWRVVHLWGPNTENLQSKYNIIRGQVAEVSGGTWTDVGSIIGSTPQPDWFTDWTVADLHLTANATAAIDGASPLAEVPEDYDEESRGSSPDIGADEYQGVVLPTVTLSATDPNAAEEGQDTGTFTVSRNQTSGNLVVYYSVSGTAGSGDYEETLSGSVTIPDTQASTTITITPVDDSEIEGNETVILTLTADSAYTIGSPSSGTVTIADNDVALPVVTLSATDPNAAEEGQDTGTFTVSRDQTAGNLVVNYSVSGTAGSGDYEETLSGSVTIPDTQASTTITITPVDDSEIEGNETVILTLTADPAYTIGTPSSGTVTIADNDVALPVVTLSATDPNAAEEGQDTGTFTVSRDQTAGNLVVNYSVSGTAAAGDYEETLTGSVTIPDTQASTTITITPVDDSEVEGNETVILTLTADPAYTIGTPSSGTVTIADNDVALPVVTLSATDPNAAEEGQDTGTFMVSRDQTAGNLVVNYSVSGTAAGGDYEETLTGSVTIPDTQASTTITITPVDDSEVEGNETVILTLTADPAYTIGTPSSGTVTIADNDVALPVVTLSATDPNAAEEGQDTGTFTVSRDQTAGNLVVNYSVSGTAAAGDYEETLTGSVTIPDAQASTTITITPVDDSEVEPDETVILTLTADPAYTIGSPNSGTVTIADNDAGGPETLFSDGFESGNFTAGGWSTGGLASVSSGAAYSGSYGAKLKKVASITKALSTAGYTGIQVKCYWKTVALDSGEYLFCEWSDNAGQNWYELGKTQATAWGQADFTCPAGAANNPDFQVRFRTNAGQGNEYGYVDDVEIIGTAQ